MCQSGRDDSDSEDSNCGIDSTGTGTRRGYGATAGDRAERLPSTCTASVAGSTVPRLHGPPLASISQSLLEAGSYGSLPAAAPRGRRARNLAILASPTMSGGWLNWRNDLTVRVRILGNFFNGEI
ncbi:hypothetical protein THAOC_09628 [Thalassiosira oceanica]|uniref:Uncharacterized protein n=1 Tax=Thalassiosira oceanica TaxID=159749 RepID=K0SW27_THAOC|nr:hypothetical protein THAOC_09628 [Thalassiosira oceanica]|eukprot:EJK69149.1 hypothetical protein THAOC_09628 [Thalassiosira oceanica]